MARRAPKPQQPAATQPPNVQADGMPSDMAEIEIIESKETWSIYKLADGTTVRLRPILASAFRSRTQFLPDGNPVYGIRSGVIPDFQIATKLKKKKI